jgi:hypothetical protein
MWFKKLTGFEEISPKQVRENIVIEDDRLKSKVNGKSYQLGYLQVPTLLELKEQVPEFEKYDDEIKVSEVIANVQELHIDPENRGALFQVASQFNLLEMINPNITPAHGIDRYKYDMTQGPICAITCGAGTIYRNYFAQVNGKVGQTVDNQIDCLEFIGKELGNYNSKLWRMKNGYVITSQEALINIATKISNLSYNERESLKSKLKIGIQWETEVTISDNKQIVSQAYCSALPVSYSNIEPSIWESFARLILEASYESTFYAGLLNIIKTGLNKVFLTLVGGGAFGNEPQWIIDAISSAIDKFRNTPLDVRIVSYGGSNMDLKGLIDRNYN